MKIKVVNQGKIPIKIWAAEVEPGAMAQAINLANFPFAFHHLQKGDEGHIWLMVHSGSRNIG